MTTPVLEDAQAARDARATTLRDIDDSLTDCARALALLGTLRATAQDLAARAPRTTFAIKSYDLSTPGAHVTTELGLPDDVVRVLEGAYRDPVRALIDAIDRARPLVHAHMQRAEEDRARVEVARV